VVITRRISQTVSVPGGGQWGGGTLQHMADVSLVRPGRRRSRREHFPLREFTVGDVKRFLAAARDSSAAVSVLNSLSCARRRFRAKFALDKFFGAAAKLSRDSSTHSWH